MTTPSSRLLVGLLAAGALSACASTPKIARVDVGQQIDLSGNWNDTDARQVADTMITLALRTQWVDRYMKANGGKTPSVVVGRVVNKSSEHINTALFINRLEDAFTNSGAVAVVNSGAMREEQRAERADQQQNAAADTRARVGAEAGANFMLQGEINSSIDSEGGTSVKFYQIDLRITNMETNVRTWAGSHQIKKVVQKPRLRS